MAGALAVAGLAFTAAPAGAVANVTAGRLSGADRFETAANVCDQVAPTGAANVILATGRVSFADALTGSALAGDRNTCILLTERDSLPAATSAQLTQMKALGTPLTSVTILGGQAAVTTAVQTAVTGLGGLTVDRIEGADRYATAAAIATAIGAVGAIGGQGTAIIANGENQFQGADALAVGPVAARGDGTNPFPILLVQDDAIPAPTATALAAAGIDNLIAVGGETAISAATLAAAATAVGDATPTRVSGATREDTAVAIAGLAVQQGFVATQVLLANGRIGDFSADALVAGPLGDRNGAVTLLTSGTSTLGAAAQSYLDANSNRITTVTAIGGESVIAPATLTAAETAAETTTNDNTQVSVTPDDTVTLGDQAARAYTATFTNADGTPFTGVVGIQLLDVTAAGAPVYNTDAANVVIESVDGVAQGGMEFNGFAGIDGKLDFIVRDTNNAAAADAVPVAWKDLDADSGYESTGNNAPVGEPFDLGGVVNFTVAAPTEASVATALAGLTVATTNAAANSFTASGPDCGNGAATACTFAYDANDIFQISGGVVTLDAFEAALTATDVVSTTYLNTGAADGNSVFNITTNNTPTAPLTVSSPSATTTVDANNANISGTGQPGNTVEVFNDTNNDGNFDTGEALVATTTVAAGGTWQTTVPLTQNAANNFVVYQRAPASAPVANNAAGGADVPTITEGVDAGPTLTTAIGANGAGTAGVLDIADVITLTFSENMTVTAGQTVELIDEDGTRARITCGAGGNATCAGSGTTVITITLTLFPTVVTAGGTAGLQDPAQVVQVGFLATADAQALNLAQSTDVLVNTF